MRPNGSHARVTHVISTPRGVGGAERLVRDLVEHGAAIGRHDVVLNPFATEHNGALADLLHGHDYRSHVGARSRDLPATARWLTRQLRALRPDIVHAHLFHASVMTAWLPLPHSTHRLLTHHHGDVLVVNRRLFAQALDDRSTRRYDTVAAVSQRGATFLTERGVPRDRVVVIPNGWRPPARHHERAPSSRPTVVCVANFRPEKDHEALIEAFRLVLDTVPAARLRLVGDGPCRERLIDQSSRLDLGDNVEFAGTSGDVWAELARADVFALSSRYEGMSLALLEALAAGVPAVVTDVGANAELVDRAAGLVVPPGEPRMMATALTSLLTDPARRERLSDGARRAADRYPITSTLEAYANLYDRLMTRSSR